MSNVNTIKRSKKTKIKSSKDTIPEVKTKRVKRISITTKSYGVVINISKARGGQKQKKKKIKSFFPNLIMIIVITIKLKKKVY